MSLLKQNVSFALHTHEQRFTPAFPLRSKQFSFVVSFQSVVCSRAMYSAN